MKADTKRLITWTVLFAIAMGFMETAVVVYLRELYYPDGFQFPLQPIPKGIAVVEFWREIATIIMLVGTGIIAGNTRLTRFAYFIIAFAVWDIFYYVFLYMLIAWPQSLSTWDILFLVPVPWVGPVWAPCIVSLEMIFFGVMIIHYNENSLSKVTQSQWLLLISGVVVIIASFISDYVEQVTQNAALPWNIFSQSQLFKELETYVPKTFCWWLFGVGDFLCALGVFSYIKSSIRNKKASSSK